MNRPRILFVTLLAFLFLFQISGIKADSYSVAQEGYNLVMLTSGILCYYNLHGDWPDSIDTLYSEQLIPDNLKNPFTGESINGNSEDQAPGTYAIVRTGQDNIEFIQYREGNPETLYYGPEEKLNNATGMSLEDLTRIKLWHWSRACLPASHCALGEIPQSVDEIIKTGFWPYSNVLNVYTSEPVKFDSHEPGDMYWNFMDEKILVRFFSIPAGDAESAGMAYRYPTTAN